MTSTELTAFVRKNPIGFGCGALCVLLAMGSYYRSAELPNRIAELEERTAEGERLSTNLKYGAQLNEQLAALTTAREQIDTRLVRGSELAKNLQYFYRLEAETGTKLLTLRQNPPAAKPNPKNAFVGVSFSVSLQGEYFAVLDALRRIERGVHHCRVVNASLNSLSLDRTGPVTLSLSLELLGQP